MEAPHKRPITLSELKSAGIIPPQELAEEAARVNRIEAEFARGFTFIDSLPKTITFFGSSRATEDNPHYQTARALAKQLVEDQNFGVVTGGGHGIMEAANRGAFEAGGVSAGLTIQLPTGLKPNKYLNRRCDFHYFFARKVILSFAARMYIFFPGGFGTLDEFTEILTLIQTNKIQTIPVVCIGADYWQPLHEFMKKILLEQNQAIDASDLNLFTITDHTELACEIASYTQKRV